MGFYEYNSFGKFQAEADYTDALPANAELISGYERALGEQHEIYTDFDVSAGKTAKLAVYKNGDVYDLIALEGTGATDYKLLKHYGEFETEDAATAEFDNLVGECSDPNATYNQSTNKCDCNEGYLLNSDTGLCEAEEESFVKENAMAIGIGAVALALVGIVLSRR